MIKEIIFNINEAISPTPITFGTNFPNFDNKSYKEIESLNASITFFKDNDKNIEKLYYFGLGTDGDITFSLMSNFNKNLLLEDNIKKYATMENKVNNALKVFNKVFYILIIFLNHYDIPDLSFNGSNEKLSKFYNYLIKNKKFLDKMKNIGYEYDGIEDGVHWFTKK